MKIKTLLKSKEQWCQGAFARDANGENLFDGGASGAVCWCLMGAAQKCYPGERAKHAAFSKLWKAIDSLFSRKKAGDCLSSFNDDSMTTFADIKKVLAKANI